LIIAAMLLPAPLLARDIKVEFIGAPRGLEDELRLVSTVAASPERLATRAALRRAAAADATALAGALHAAGYYAAKARARPLDADAALVIFEIEPGPLFSILGADIVYEDAPSPGETRPDSLAAADIDEALTPDGAALAALQQRFLNRLWEDGYPKARILSRRVDADFAAGTARAVFAFESGRKASFGEVKVSGGARVDPGFVEAMKPFEPGATFQRSKLADFRDRLSDTDLFDAVDVEPGPQDPSGAAPVLVTLEERKARTIGVGVSYSTVEGPGGRIFLEHRNALGRGERIYAEIEGSQIRQSVGGELSRPMPRENGALFATARFINEATGAFDAQTLALSGGAYVRAARERLELRGAVALETASVKSETEDEQTYFVSFPLTAVWNSEDDLLDPSRGVRASFAATPTTGTDSYARLEGAARTRIKFGPANRLTLATRTRLAATLGTSFDTLPANKRLYSGGGASVRGYAFQAVGPLDANGDPTGGLSAVEGAIELRARVTRRLEVAGFLDAGAVSTDRLPDFAGPYLVGAGGGLRYLSPAGPIRIDAATPVNGRDGDRAFQIYISLGQAF
jgi:translocation and assembly module TamA